MSSGLELRGRVGVATTVEPFRRGVRDCVGVPATELRFDLRETGDDIMGNGSLERQVYWSVKSKSGGGAWTKRVILKLRTDHATRTRRVTFANTNRKKDLSLIIHRVYQFRKLINLFLLEEDHFSFI